MAKGFELFAREAGLKEQLAWADLVLTGEGSIDQSSLMGKGVGELAALCAKARKPCLGFGGAVRLKGGGPFSIVRALSDLADPEQAMKRASVWLARLARVGAREWSGAPRTVASGSRRNADRT